MLVISLSPSLLLQAEKMKSVYLLVLVILFCEILSFYSEIKKNTFELDEVA